MKTIKEILEGMGSAMLAILIIMGVAFGVEKHNMHAFNKALDKGVEPSKEGIYVVPFSKKKDLLVVPRLWAYNRETRFRRFKKGDMMTLMSLSGLHRPSTMPSKKQKEAFYEALKNGAEPNSTGVYLLPLYDHGTPYTLVVIPIRTRVDGETKVRYVSIEPSDYYFWRMSENDKLMALITDDGDVIRF